MASFLERNLPILYKLLNRRRSAAEDDVQTLDLQPLAPAAEPEESEPPAEAAPQEPEPPTTPPPTEDVDRLDQALREVFDQGPIVDPLMEGLLARVERVDARSLADELKALARSIGA